MNVNPLPSFQDDQVDAAAGLPAGDDLHGATAVLDVVDDYVDALLADALPFGAPPATCDAVAELAGASLATGTASADAHAPALLAVEPPVAPPVHVPVPAAMPTESDPAPAAPVAAAPVIPLSAPTSAHATAVEATPPRRRGPPTATQRWLRATVGEASYAVELLCVQEVVRLAPIVAMRGARRAVLGVMNLRGRIVPVFDLGLWLETDSVRTDERSRIVVVERDDELIGVLVTAVEDVVWLDASRIEPPLAGTLPGPILGVARVGATPTVLLDANELFG